MKTHAYKLYIFKNNNDNDKHLVYIVNYGKNFMWKIFYLILWKSNYFFHTLLIRKLSFIFSYYCDKDQFQGSQHHFLLALENAMCHCFIVFNLSVI